MMIVWLYQYYSYLNSIISMRLYVLDILRLPILMISSYFRSTILLPNYCIASFLPSASTHMFDAVCERTVIPVLFWEALEDHAIALTTSCNTERFMNEWMYEWMDGWMGGWMNEWVDGWMNEWMDGWMNGWMNECMNGVWGHNSTF